MDIQTVRFGKITVEDEKVLVFPKGILGFSNCKRFVLLPHKEDSPFFWLQSIEDGELAFVLMNPNLVKEDYAVEIDEEQLQELDSTEENNNLDVLCIVNIPKDNPRDMTINLQGPIIINGTSMRAVQVVLTTTDYSYRHPVMQQAR